MIEGPLDAYLEPISDVVGFPVDQFKFVLCLLLSYPFGFVYRYLRPNDRHFYSITVGFFVVIFCFGLMGLIHFMASSLVMYAALSTLPSRVLPKTAFFFMFAYLSALHIYRMVTDYMGYKLDATALMMVLVIKISSLACNYYDGKRLATEEENLTPAHKEFCISKLPTLLEYYSFLFFFPTFLAGPAFHFKPYIMWIEDKIYVHEKFNPSGVMPNPTMAVLESFGLAVVLVVGHLVLTSMFPLDIIFSVDGPIVEMSIFSRHIYVLVAVFGIRLRYYFIWKLSEGAGTLTGLGFSGYDDKGNPTWTRLTNINILKIESFGCLRDITTYWNIKTGEWLKNYVYFRQTKNPNKDRIPTYALYLTNTASAFWHGFYPGYYLAFVYAAFFTDIARQIRTLFRPMVTVGKGKDEKPVYPQYYLYDILGRIFSMWIFDYGFITFVGLSIERSLIAYGNLGYSGHILSLVAFVALYVYSFVVPRPKQTKPTPAPTTTTTTTDATQTKTEKTE